MIDGEVTQVNIAARDLSRDGIPQTSWVSQHLTYTHGFGAVVSPANAATADGQPELEVRDVPVDPVPRRAGDRPSPGSTSARARPAT